MKHLTMQLRRSLAFATGLLVAAIVATSALAANRPDDHTGIRAASTSSAAQPDLIERLLAAGNARTASPDLIERMLAVQALRSSTGRPDDRAGVRGDFPASASAVAGSTEGVAFHWSDAGVGAAMAAAILLITGSGLAVVRRASRRRRFSAA